MHRHALPRPHEPDIAARITEIRLREHPDHDRREALR